MAPWKLAPLILVAALCLGDPATGATRKSRSSKKSRAAKSGKKTQAKSWRSGQQRPTPERYKEIQQALSEKGYFEEAPSGNWDSGSAEALRRFQRDQNLEPSGRLDAMSLIALGLAPKRETQASAAPTP